MNEGKAGGGMTTLMTKGGEEKDPRINDESSQGWRNVHVLRQRVTVHRIYTVCTRL